MELLGTQSRVVTTWPTPVSTCMRPTPSTTASEARSPSRLITAPRYRRPSVRVHTIRARPFQTDVAAHWDTDVVGHRPRSYPLGRVGQPAEVVEAVIYLPSDASSFTTGSVPYVNGGMGIAHWRIRGTL